LTVGVVTGDRGEQIMTIDKRNSGVTWRSVNGGGVTAKRRDSSIRGGETNMA